MKFKLESKTRIIAIERIFQKRVQGNDKEKALAFASP